MTPVEGYSCLLEGTPVSPSGNAVSPSKVGYCWLPAHYSRWEGEGQLPVSKATFGRGNVISRSHTRGTLSPRRRGGANRPRQPPAWYIASVPACLRCVQRRSQVGAPTPTRHRTVTPCHVAMRQCDACPRSPACLACVQESACSALRKARTDAHRTGSSTARNSGPR